MNADEDFLSYPRSSVFIRGSGFLALLRQSTVDFVRIRIVCYRYKEGCRCRAEILSVSFSWLALSQRHHLKLNF